MTVHEVNDMQSIVILIVYICIILNTLFSLYYHYCFRQEEMEYDNN